MWELATTKGGGKFIKDNEVVKKSGPLALGSLSPCVRWNVVTGSIERERIEGEILTSSRKGQGGNIIPPSLLYCI